MNWWPKLTGMLFVTATIIFTLFSCGDTKKQTTHVAIEGTWELLSETKIENRDTTFTPAASTQRMIKIINKTHFSFLRHNLKATSDSTLSFVAGGGTYSLSGNIYKEHLEFFGARDWEDHDFSFEVEIINDTLIQKGQEKIEGTGIDRFIIERYRRVEI